MTDGGRQRTDRIKEDLRRRVFALGAEGGRLDEEVIAAVAELAAELGYMVLGPDVTKDMLIQTLHQLLQMQLHEAQRHPDEKHRWRKIVQVDDEDRT